MNTGQVMPMSSQQRPGLLSWNRLTVTCQGSPFLHIGLILSSYTHLVSDEGLVGCINVRLCGLIEIDSCFMIHGWWT